MEDDTRNWISEGSECQCCTMVVVKQERCSHSLHTSGNRKSQNDMTKLIHTDCNCIGWTCSKQASYITSKIDAFWFCRGRFLWTFITKFINIFRRNLVSDINIICFIVYWIVLATNIISYKLIKLFKTRQLHYDAHICDMLLYSARHSEVYLWQKTLWLNQTQTSYV